VKTWFPVPMSWINSPAWHSLTPRARVLLFLLWAKSETGEVPTDPKAVQVLSGMADRPKRIAEAVEELKAAGFIEREETGFFLASFRTILAKFRHKSGTNLAKNVRKKRTIPETSADLSRARAFPPKGEKKRKDEKGTNPPGGGSSFSSELDPRVLELMKVKP